MKEHPEACLLRQEAGEKLLVQRQVVKASISGREIQQRCLL